MTRGVSRLVLVGCGLALACSAEEQPETGRTFGRPDPPPLTASDENEPPRVDDVTLEPRRPLPGRPIRALVEASDPDGDPLRTRFVWILNGRALEASGERVDLRNAVKGDRLEVEVVVSDGQVDSEPYRLATELANQPPRLYAVGIESPDQAEPGLDLVASPRAEDADGDALEFRYTWRVNGESVDEPGPSLSTSALRRGDRVSVAVIADDGDDESELRESPPVTIGNAPPEIESAVAWKEEAGVFRYQVEARDPDGDRNLRYRLTKAPEGMKIDPLLGAIAWKPDPEKAAGRHPVEVEVDDLQGGRGVQRFEMAIRLEEEAAELPEQPPAAPADD